MLVCLFYLPCLLALSSKYLHLYSVNACCPSQLEDIVGHTPDTRGISQMKQTISTIHNEKIIVTVVSAAKAKIKNGQLSGGGLECCAIRPPHDSHVCCSFEI